MALPFASLTTFSIITLILSGVCFVSCKHAVLRIFPPTSSLKERFSVNYLLLALFHRVVAAFAWKIPERISGLSIVVCQYPPCQS